MVALAAAGCNPPGRPSGGRCLELASWSCRSRGTIVTAKRRPGLEARPAEAAMSKSTVMVTFPRTTVAEANRWASSLADAIRDIDPNVAVDRHRERPDTQDFGAT